MPTRLDTAHRRATPVQARSAKTLDQILVAAAELLVEQGLPGFNTNAVAKAAGVNVATLYHYFPHKAAILRDLFERYETERLEYVGARMESLARGDDLDTWLGVTLGGLLELRFSRVGCAALRRACRALPELMDAEEGFNRDATAGIAAALRERLPTLTAARAAMAGRAVVEVTAALMDFAGERPEVAEEMVLELRTLMLGYLAELAQV
jgi:AcrR family transcriptional regulator